METTPYTVTRTVKFTFETEEQASAFDAAMNDSRGFLPYGIRYTPGESATKDDSIDLALAFEYLASRAIDAKLPDGNTSPGMGVEIPR